MVLKWLCFPKNYKNYPAAWGFDPRLLWPSDPLASTPWSVTRLITLVCLADYSFDTFFLRFNPPPHHDKIWLYACNKQCCFGFGFYQSEGRLLLRQDSMIRSGQYRQPGRWQLDSKIEMVPWLFPGQDNQVHKDVITNNFIHVSLGSVA